MIWLAKEKKSEPLPLLKDFTRNKGVRALHLQTHFLCRLTSLLTRRKGERKSIKEQFFSSFVAKIVDSYACNSRTFILFYRKLKERAMSFKALIWRGKKPSIYCCFPCDVNYRVCLIKESWLRTIKIKISYIYLVKSNNWNVGKPASEVEEREKEICICAKEKKPKTYDWCLALVTNNFSWSKIVSTTANYLKEKKCFEICFPREVLTTINFNYRLIKGNKTVQAKRKWLHWELFMWKTFLKIIFLCNSTILQTNLFSMDLLTWKILCLHFSIFVFDFANTQIHLCQWISCKKISNNSFKDNISIHYSSLNGRKIVNFLFPLTPLDSQWVQSQSFS